LPQSSKKKGKRREFTVIVQGRQPIKVRADFWVSGRNDFCAAKPTPIYQFIENRTEIVAEFDAEHVLAIGEQMAEDM